MRRILLLLALFGAGCNKEPKGNPSVKVDRSETANGVVLTVYYYNHKTGQNSSYNCFTVIDTPEQLQEYKQQTEFLLGQIEEAEKRMKAHEQGVPSAK